MPEQVRDWIARARLVDALVGNVEDAALRQRLEERCAGRSVEELQDLLLVVRPNLVDNAGLPALDPDDILPLPADPVTNTRQGHPVDTPGTSKSSGGPSASVKRPPHGRTPSGLFITRPALPAGTPKGEGEGEKKETENEDDVEAENGLRIVGNPIPKTPPPKDYSHIKELVPKGGKPKDEGLGGEPAGEAKGAGPETRGVAKNADAPPKAADYDTGFHARDELGDVKDAAGVGRKPPSLLPTSRKGYRRGTDIPKPSANPAPTGGYRSTPKQPTGNEGEREPVENAVDPDDILPLPVMTF